MDVLSRAAAQGIQALSEAEVDTVLQECTQGCDQRGDARYCVLGELFGAISEWRSEHDEAGGVPAALLGDIDQRIIAQLPAVLAESDPSVAAQLAATLRDNVRSRLLSPQEWS